MTDRPAVPEPEGVSDVTTPDAAAESDLGGGTVARADGLERPDESTDQEEAVEALTREQELEAERDRLTDALARSQADFANYRKRIAREGEALTERVKASLLDALVPVLDAFDSAAEHAAEDVAPLRDLLWNVANRAGLEVVRPEPGTNFDPNLHEAVSAKPVTKSDDVEIVTELARPGYRLGERLLRPAAVHVGAGSGSNS